MNEAFMELNDMRVIMTIFILGGVMGTLHDFAHIFASVWTIPGLLMKTRDRLQILGS